MKDVYYITVGEADAALVINDRVIFDSDDANEMGFNLDALASRIADSLNVEVRRSHNDSPPFEDWNWGDIIETLPPPKGPLDDKQAQIMEIFSRNFGGKLVAELDSDFKSATEEIAALAKDNSVVDAVAATPHPKP